MGQGDADAAGMQLRVGVSDELTDEVLRAVQAHPPSQALLPVYNLLVLERFEATVPLIRAAMDRQPDLEYITSLQKSRFYVQRRCVPYIAAAIPPEERKTVLRTSLRDPICAVVSEAVGAILKSSPFSSDELLGIAADLYGSRYTTTRMLSVDILILIQESRPLLLDVLRENNWRMRLRCASLLGRFNPGDQERIVAELRSDHVDEVRAALARNLHTLDHIDFLGDPCDTVRANYLANVVNMIDDQAIFSRITADESWDVRKILLNLRGEWFRKITIPLIKTSTENVKWRTKIEVLDLIDNQVGDSFVSRLMASFLIRALHDRVCEVRRRAQAVLLKIIAAYDWCAEYADELRAAAGSENYLYRIATVAVAIAFDRRFGTGIADALMNDRVENVRLCYSDCIAEDAAPGS